MFLTGSNSGALRRFIRDEVDFAEEIGLDRRGRAVERIQEWLNLHGHGLVVDGEFGPATEAGVRTAQIAFGLPANGIVTEDTFAALVAPMRLVLVPLQTLPESFTETVLAFARQHLAVHPREIGGQNAGPWVRLYMQGHQGKDWPWCAGFVSFLIEQAAEQRGETAPILGSFSCDTLAAQGREAGRFLAEGTFDRATLPGGALFLVRRTATDWTHVGLVDAARSADFSSIEGNTNDDGDREGYEVCARFRGYGAKDFVML
ncbi:protein with peptidoglycan-binding domain protein [Rhodobacterales bacterium HKCCE3408]|nr:protein with peptidoglycan-binding domain protein [Rhodobacterales bacterium HKCCE3408]